MALFEMQNTGHYWITWYGINCKHWQPWWIYLRCTQFPMMIMPWSSCLNFSTGAQSLDKEVVHDAARTFIFLKESGNPRFLRSTLNFMGPHLLLAPWTCDHQISFRVHANLPAKPGFSAHLVIYHNEYSWRIINMTWLNFQHFHTPYYPQSHGVISWCFLACHTTAPKHHVIPCHS